LAPLNISKKEMTPMDNDFFKVLCRLVILEKEVDKEKALEEIKREFPGLNIENFLSWRSDLRNMRYKIKALGKRKWGDKKNKR